MATYSTCLFPSRVHFGEPGRLWGKLCGRQRRSLCGGLEDPASHLNSPCLQLVRCSAPRTPAKGVGLPEQVLGLPWQGDSHPENGGCMLEVHLGD